MISTQTSKDKDQLMDRPMVISTLFYLTVFVFIGVPIWFYTCSTTRYSLPPLTDLEAELRPSNANLHLQVSVIHLQSNPDENLLDFLRTQLPLTVDTPFENITYRIEWRIRRPTSKEIELFKNFESDNSAKLTDFEFQLRTFHKSSSRFRMFIYVPEEANYRKYDCKLSHTYNVGHDRFSFICPNNIMLSYEKYEPFRDMIVQLLDTTHFNSVKRVDHMLSSKIDLVFSIIHEDVKISHLYEKTNMIHHIFEKNIKIKFPELSEILNMRVITQHLNGFKIDSVTDVNASRRLVSMEEVESIFNRFESRISKHSVNDVFNLLLFLPSSDKHSFVFKNNSPSKLTDELSIIIGPDANSMLIVNDEKSLVLGLRAFFRYILGLSNVGLCSNCNVKRDTFLNLWEIDAIVGALTMRKLQSTLVSLSSIDTKKFNIRIIKEVANQANIACTSAIKSVKLLKSKNILEAYRQASQAYELSETAFFDPSLLELYYFPDDLKYAVYLPLFLPLAFPIILSVFRLIKLWRS